MKNVRSKSEVFARERLSQANISQELSERDKEIVDCLHYLCNYSKLKLFAQSSINTITNSINDFYIVFLTFSV